MFEKTKTQKITCHSGKSVVVVVIVVVIFIIVVDGGIVGDGYGGGSEVF